MEKNKLFISKTFKNNTFRAVIIVPWNWYVSHCQNLVLAPSIDWLFSYLLWQAGAAVTVTHFPWQYLQNRVRVIHFRMNLQSFTPGSEWPVFFVVHHHNEYQSLVCPFKIWKRKESASWNDSLMLFKSVGENSEILWMDLFCCSSVAVKL